MSLCEQYIVAIILKYKIKSKYEFVFNLYNYLLQREKNILTYKNSQSLFYNKLFSSSKNIFNNTIVRLSENTKDDDNLPAECPVTSQEKLFQIIDYLNVLIYRSETEKLSNDDILELLDSKSDLFTLSQQDDGLKINNIPYTEEDLCFVYNLLASTIIKVEDGSLYYKS